MAISIIIETEEELKLLWHLLNVPYVSSLEDYDSNKNFTIELNTFAYELWSKINNIYTPQGR